MRELKAYRPRELVMQGRHNELIYLKSEADKVIAEKDKEIARLDDLAHAHNIELLRKENLIAELKKERDWLAKDRAQAYDDLEKRAQLNIKQEESIRHHKYKRCLAMAKLCQWKMGVFIYKKEKNEFYYRWHKRWLKIADKFKEAK